MWISPSYEQTDLPLPWNIEDKITIFEDRVLGWKLDIADQIINGKMDPDGSGSCRGIPHSGYAVLDIVISYFEMIAKYMDGFDKEGKSKRYFIQGVYAVFPPLKVQQRQLGVQEVYGDSEPIIEQILGMMYKNIRCGLYHGGITTGRVGLTGDFETPIIFQPQSATLMINPHHLVPTLKIHFSNYIECLKDPNNHDFRRKFEARFDFDTDPQNETVNDSQLPG